MRMLEQLTLADFKPLEGDELLIRFGDHEQAGTLVQARPVVGGAPQGREPFSLVVRSGSPDRHWPQGIYTLVHPEHGELDLFMVPIGPDEAGMRYEVTFS
jgi:hypothetical protein